MLKFIGKGVCGGTAIGPAVIYKKEELKIKRIAVKDPEKELLRFERAKEKSAVELQKIYEKALVEVGETGAEIFQIHLMMLDDEDFNASVRRIIVHQTVNAEYAISVTAENFSHMFSSMDDHYMKARAIDVKDISERLILSLSETRGSDALERPSIICARDLTPSETVLFDKDKILGFITTHGSANSHTAILARNMNIPAVIGVGDSFLLNVKEGDLLAVDGRAGEIFVEPDSETVIKIREKENENKEKTELLKKLRGKDNITLDGKKINLYANIQGTEDIGAVLASDAGGIGLFRSEFLYLDKDTFPREEEQFEAYKKVLVAMSGKKVIIRTLDIGADKKVGYFSLDEEENPALGLRGLRLCLKRPEILKAQLRALFSASKFGSLGIMFPMVTNYWEGERIIDIVNEVKAELDKSGVPYSRDVELGIMIETPAAALISDKLATLFDFFSIGTNDLSQYTLACDRQNPNIEEFFDPYHEGIMRLIKMSADSIHKKGGWIGICGELAGDLNMTESFLEMGIDELSVSPSEILKLRDKVRKTRVGNN